MRAFPFRTLAAALTIVGVAAGPATAGPASSAEAVCRYAPPSQLSHEERKLRDTIAARKHWGFPHGRAFVRRVNASRAARRREAELLLPFPATAREARYFRLRRLFQDERYTGRLDAYLRTQRATLGGRSIEDDYPRSPYMLVRFTKDLARHRREIAKRFALRFIVRRSRYTERELRRIHNAIDWDALERENIHVVGSGTQDDRVVLEVTTPRADVRDVVRRLYGPAVSVTVLAATRTFLECSSPETYRVSEDGRTLTVTYVHSGSAEPRHLEVVESATEVRVGAVSEVPHGAITADAVTYTLSVTLSEPLGDRVVRSIRTGRRVRLSSER